MMDCCYDCRPLGFLIGIPFALISLILSLLGAIVWILGYQVSNIGLPLFMNLFALWRRSLWKTVLTLKLISVSVLKSVLSCLCPCCVCCVGILDLAMCLVTLPVDVIRWFIDQIPC